ncbi:MAG: hypothetical protein C4549_02765 [Deltaproteobacteria bacterium]|jgi:ribosomal protein L37AE/L43A|nr:MAG: hypothetical protein C4549_02765 [Deltaproteobacteria bacterium]
MLNPGYKVIAKEEKMECDPGQIFMCPHCRQPVLEAMAEKFRTKCKKCKHWIYGEKIVDNNIKTG